MRAAFIRGLICAAQKNPRIMLITGDLGYRYLEPFAHTFPDRFLNIGVSEANMVTVAAGLSTTGFVPFIYSIATFASMRAFEQIRTDIAMQKLNVKIVGIGAGLAYTKAGPTHHSMEDIALMRMLPDMTIVSPIDTFEAESATQVIADHDGPCYLRLEHNPENSFHSRVPNFTLAKGYSIRKPDYNSGYQKKVAILVTGTKVDLVEKAADILERKKIVVSIIAMPTIAPLDFNCIHDLVKSQSILVTVEEHRTDGGFGTAVGEYLLENHSTHMPTLIKIGLKNEFTPISGDYTELLRYHRLLPRPIADRILKFL